MKCGPETAFQPHKVLPASNYVPVCEKVDFSSNITITNIVDQHVKDFIFFSKLVGPKFSYSKYRTSTFSEITQACLMNIHA